MAASPVRSPWTSTSLTRVVLADMAGLKPGAVTRAQAMKVPGVARGRGLICGTLSRYPLTRWAGETRLDPAPWMVSTRTGQSPRLRMLWTLDDVLFSGLSPWAVERGPAGESGSITDALRIPPGRWAVEPSGAVLVDGKPASAEEVLLFEGPQEGLLTIADEAVEASRAMAAAWSQRVKSPIPLINIKQRENTLQLNKPEIEGMLDDFEAARSNGGGTTFTPAEVDAEVLGDVKADLYIEGRNAERLDWGNYVGLPAAMLDGSMSTATLTYSTSEGKRSEFVDFSLAYWAMPIEARLSQDDVLPEGQDCRFDLAYLTSTVQPATNPGQED